jgi:hypothetical protein
VKHTFPMNHRTKNRQNSACAVCHPAKINAVTPTGVATTTPSYASYTCYNCHHTQEREARRHAKRRVAKLNDCASCHPTGREKRGRTALEGDSDLEFCQGCPAPTVGKELLNDFLLTSCPLTTVASGWTPYCKGPGTLLLSPRQLPNRNILRSGSTLPTRHDSPLKATTIPAAILDFSAFDHPVRPLFGSDFAVVDRLPWSTPLAMRTVEFGVTDPLHSRRNSPGHPQGLVQRPGP